MLWWNDYRGDIWSLSRSPDLEYQCCTPGPVTVWSASGSLLYAYRPTDKSSSEENDCWLGPWRTPDGASVATLDWIQDRLWMTTSGGSHYRLDPAAIVRSAESAQAVRTTAQWRQGYYGRLGTESWLTAVRMHIALKEWDNALVVLNSARGESRAATQPGASETDRVLWEILVRARKGDFETADRLSTALIDDPKADSVVKALALGNLAGIRYDAGNWQGVLAATQKMIALFPEMGAPASRFNAEPGESLKAYAEKARSQLAASQPAGPTSAGPGAAP
jgi:hypothetical protein